MSQGQNQFSVKRLYQSVIEDVMTGVREVFLDDGVDEQVLQELRMLWENKLAATKATEPLQPSSDNNTATNGTTNNQPPAPQQQSSTSSSHLPPLPVDELIPIQITMPAQANDPNGGIQRSITIQVPSSCIHNNKLQEILTLPAIQATLALPSDIAAAQLQNQVNQILNVRTQSHSTVIKQAPVIKSQQKHNNSKMLSLDGNAGDSSDEDDDDDDDDDDDMDDDLDDKDDEKEDEPEDEGQDEEPLNSEDDVSDNEDSNDKLYEIDNVVVCQYDKITRTKNKWKFTLSSGIMNLNGKDYVFARATGEADW